MLKQPVEQDRRHHFITEIFASLLEALVAGEPGRRMSVAAAHELEGVRAAGSRDGQVADLIDYQQRGMRQRIHPVRSSTLPGGVGLEIRDQIGQDNVVNAAAVLIGGVRPIARCAGRPVKSGIGQPARTTSSVQRFPRRRVNSAKSTCA